MGMTSTSVPFFRWIPYVAAACLMILGISGMLQILDLKSQLLASRTDAARMRESNALRGLRLATLEAKAAVTDASYASAEIIIAWDSYQYQGTIAMKNLPEPAAGFGYQLWVLDPSAEAPVSAGVITGSGPFAVKPISTQNPGFAISLEPVGGSPEPTGPILFAVAPGS